MRLTQEQVDQLAALIRPVMEFDQRTGEPLCGAVFNCREVAEWLRSGLGQDFNSTRFWQIASSSLQQQKDREELQLLSDLIETRWSGLDVE